APFVSLDALSQSGRGPRPVDARFAGRFSLPLDGKSRPLARIARTLAERRKSRKRPHQRRISHPKPVGMTLVTSHLPRARSRTSDTFYRAWRRTFRGQNGPGRCPHRSMRTRLLACPVLGLWARG